MVTNITHYARIALFSLGMAATSAQGALVSSGFGSTLLDIDTNGMLQGAQNVDVGGTLYDVAFVDGLQTDIFPTLADLDATTEAQATAFSQALLDFVLVDIAAGLFDSDPSRVNGCDLIFQCSILTLWEFDQFGYGAQAANNSNTEAFDGTGLTSGGFSDTSNNTLFTFADWSLSNVVSPNPNPISAPATTALFGLGFIVFAVRKRRANR